MARTAIAIMRANGSGEQQKTLLLGTAEATTGDPVNFEVARLIINKDYYDALSAGEKTVFDGLFLASLVTLWKSDTYDAYTELA